MAESSAMIAAELPVPRDWQVFEDFCRDLFAAEWNDPEAQKHGRSGQDQKGVDVFGRRNGRWQAVQCKRRSAFPEKKLTEREVRNEVEEAREFEKGSLDTLVVATTAPPDTKLQKLARELTDQHGEGGPRVVVYGWSELTERLARHPTVDRWWRYQLLGLWPDSPERPEDEETRELSRRLKELYARRKELTIAEGDTAEVAAEIRDVRRDLRRGPQRRPGEFLCDGRFELIEMIGRGGFATVWKAWDGELLRLVAIKLLHGQYAEDRTRRERFFRGARKMAELGHPHIVRVLESELVDEGWYFFVMEYVAGGNFESAVVKEGLPATERLRVILEVGKALTYAHGEGVVHRDVKPSNILLDKKGRAKLTDFDLVHAEDLTPLTQTRAMLGTLQYAAPEALVAAAEVNAAADVYSLGSTVVFAMDPAGLPRDYYRNKDKVIAGLKCEEAVRRVLGRATASSLDNRFSRVDEFCRALGKAAAPPARKALAGPVPGPTLKALEPTRNAILKWADETGRDEFGRWARVKLAGVDVVFRWIAPGSFLMGSPDGEGGRSDREGPQRAVALTLGYWLGETPCTQELWEAVMGENRSEFRGPRRPVERVSWSDCRNFLKALNDQHRRAEVRLPTEAEWEYGCRAGTETATWLGDLDLGTDGKAPMLDSIAWYAGNSGSTTHPVGEKDPNPWGVYDILGNVREWCSDFGGAYAADPAIDPTGPVESSLRVIRGGSWLDPARFVRAAFRLWDSPGLRDSDLGFRLSRGQEPEGQEAELMARSSVRVGRGTSPRRRNGSAPAWLKAERWASEGGTDKFGRWASFEVEGVSHRLRWVKPGTFLMGSPESELGRDRYDGPQHEVTLTEGFWLGETPCTQDLWEAAMGENPSRFKGPRRPVENVSWYDCQGFFEKLNERIVELEGRLPTEAQWEYACRAGTVTATWVGDLEDAFENSKVLEEIGWYEGNAGEETLEVGRKAPNPWGFQDLLGNVEEWCRDWGHRYQAESRVDPTGPEDGSDRVIRGGSWNTHARYVRAAFRYWYDPGYRVSFLGFRLSRGRASGQAESRSKNQGSGSARRGTRRRA